MSSARPACAGIVDSMTHTDHSPLLQQARRQAWIAALAVGCTSPTDPPPEPPPDAGVMAVDPTGNWDLTYMFSAGCGQPPRMATSTFTVTRAPSGYAVTVPGATTSGTLICTPTNCKLSAMFAWSDGTWQYLQSSNILLDAQGSITGNGSESVVATNAACSFTFTVKGSKAAYFEHEIGPDM